LQNSINLKRSNLAINGGEQVRSRGWIDNFTTGTSEMLAIQRVMDSGYLSLFEGSHTPDHPFSFRGGPEVQSLELEWSTHYGVKHSIAMNSATSGLFAAIGALGIGYGDEVIVSPYTMTACALAPLIYGAIPVFADVDPETGSLNPESIAERISLHTKAVLVVHQFGIPADMDAILAITRPRGIRVIEDCAQAHGARYKGRSVGSIGDIGVFSLNVNKTIQVGEGGVCVTSDDDLAYRLQLIRNHGEAVVGPAEYSDITNIAGFNYRLTEIAAAIARVQLERLPQLNLRRLELVEHLYRGLVAIPGLEMLRQDYGSADSLSTYYVAPLKFTAHGATRNEVAEAFLAEGVPFGRGYVKPLYLQPLYQRKHLFRNGYPFSAPPNVGLRQEYGQGICPVAEQLHYCEVLINEHVRPPQTEDDVDDILKAALKIFGNGD
jgi:perosamine synthetase